MLTSSIFFLALWISKECYSQYSVGIVVLFMFTDNPCLNFILCGDCMSNYKCSWVTDNELLKDKDIHVGARKCVLTDQLSNKDPHKYIYLNSTVLEKTPGSHRSYHISHSGFTLNLRPGKVKTIEFEAKLHDMNRLDIYALIDISSSKIDFSKTINTFFEIICKYIIN
ncbi:hypothetical protein MXB_3726 [Myxobolus squamalis]|nr:hypothetical protein MXB_3726 [Myxobolus squamalis]